jgi:hypothetical protein
MIQDFLLEILFAQEQFYAIDSTNEKQDIETKGGGKYSKRKQSAVNSPA